MVLACSGAGLCNRLNNYAGSARIAAELGRPVKLWWPLKPEPRRGQGPTDHRLLVGSGVPMAGHGTPVRLVPWKGPYHEARVGAWSWMGCRFGELVTLDVAEFTRPMLGLLEEGLGRRVTLGEPITPVSS